MARDARLDVLARGLLELYPEEAARELERAPVEQTVRTLEALSASRAAAVLGRLTQDSATRALLEMNAAAVPPLLAALEPMRAASLLARLDEPQREAWLGGLGTEEAAELRALGSYPADSAGGLMDPRVLSVRPETTVSEALTRLRAYRDRKIRRLFLVDGEGRLVGSVELQTLATAGPTERLEALNSGVVSVRATGGLDEVMEILNQHHVGTLPVVDFEDRLLGVIRHDALIEAAREEATTDMQTMVGASREERALSKVSFAVRKRLPWLEVNLGTAFLAAAVVGLFESTIARNTALAVLLPVVAGQSGNTGSQALAVTMRGLALREVRTRQWLRVCLKETKVAALNGVALALTTAVVVYLWSRSAGLAMVIGVSMVISMVAAGLSGAAIPMILTGIGQDPAQSSSIILTTITDVVGFFSFLGIATLLDSML
jgi:magnesium transporter